MSDTLDKLEQDWLCGCEYLQNGELVTCSKVAHWLLNGVPVCDKDIRAIAGLNSDNEQFLRPALDEIADRHERRSLFIAAMRKPEMRLVRLALRYLDFDKGIDWRKMPEITMEPYHSDCCMLLCGTYMLVCLDMRNPGLTYEDFFFFWLHQPDDPTCRCEFCQVESLLSA